MKKISLWFVTFAWAAYTFYLTTIPNFHPTNDTLFSFILSNGGHFFFFGVLAVLFKLDKLSTFYSVLITSAYGIFIEFVQLHVPGRSFDLMDWALDTLGAIAFLAIAKKMHLRIGEFKI